MVGINLWDPSHLELGTALVTALLLGVVHGITPDEHTWPITFSYAVGGYSTRAGLRAGLLFSLAFTVQRALGSELAWLGLARWMDLRGMESALYLPVGALMLLGGTVMGRRGRTLHLHLAGRCGESTLLRPMPVARPSRLEVWMPAVHGFVAGWGFGAFALIVYATLAPAMPSAWWGWVPGALFGVGTAIVQASAGALFGRLALRRALTPEAVHAVALTTATRTLVWGGSAYLAAGALGLLLPRYTHLGLATGLHVHNLAVIGVPFVLAVGVVLGVGVTTLVMETRRWRARLEGGLQTAAATHPRGGG